MHMNTDHTPNLATAAPTGTDPREEEVEVDVDNDPGNEDPGSQFDRDATVPLIEEDE